MKNLIGSILVIILTLSVFAACEKEPETAAFGPPANIKITIDGRIMTVSWDVVKDAQGYRIVLTSVGCGSGNRTIDTKAGTAVVTSSGNTATNVEFVNETTIRVTLMADSPGANIPMATSVTAKVMSIGEIDSEFSEVVVHNIVK